MTSIVLFSGEIATGKSAVADQLILHRGFCRVSTGSFLKNMVLERGMVVDRDTLKNIGDALDVETEGKWVADVAERQVNDKPAQAMWLLDSVRRDFQIPWFKSRFARALHVHLTAPEPVKRARFEQRRKSGGEYAATTSYEEAIAGDTEQQVGALAKIADVLIDTEQLRPEDAAGSIIEWLASG